MSGKKTPIALAGATGMGMTFKAAELNVILTLLHSNGRIEWISEPEPVT